MPCRPAAASTRPSVDRRRARHAARRQHATWSRVSIAAGTSCGPCRPVSSPACASSCCSPTARPTACPATTDGRASAKSLRTWDFPKNLPDPDGQTWDESAHRRAVRHADRQRRRRRSAVTLPTGTRPGDSRRVPVAAARQTWHTHHRSAGIPTQFPLQTAALTVNGAAQTARRGLRNLDARGPLSRPRSSTSTTRRATSSRSSPTRRGTTQRRLQDPHLHDRHGRARALHASGTMPEMPEDILKRIANDKTSPDFNDAQLEGPLFLRADGGRRGAGVSGDPEPDSAVEQVGRDDETSPWARYGAGDRPRRNGWRRGASANGSRSGVAPVAAPLAAAEGRSSNREPD